MIHHDSLTFAALRRFGAALSYVSAAMRRYGWERWLILIKAVAVMSCVFYPVWWIHIHVLAGRLPTLPLSLAVSFLGVQILIILMQLFVSAAVKKMDAISRARSTSFRSMVLRALAAHLAGKEREKELVKLRRRRSADFDWSLASLLATVSGRERDALSSLAVRLGVVRRWQRIAWRGRRDHKHVLEWMAALSPEVARTALRPVLWRSPSIAQAAVYRALVWSAHPGQTGDLFRDVLRAPFLVRALLAPDFRAQAEDLADGVLRSLLRSADEAEVIAALEMVESWHQVLNLPELPRLFGHPRPEIRSLAIRTAPWSSEAGRRPGGLEDHVLNALDDPDVSVRLAALESAGRMGLKSAQAAIERAALSADGSESRSACYTLASFGAPGQATLESIICTGDSRTAAWAAEALASVKARAGVGQEKQAYA